MSEDKLLGNCAYCNLLFIEEITDQFDASNEAGSMMFHMQRLVPGFIINVYVK